MSFTGIKRVRKTRPAVKVTDTLARVFISSAGVGTILAVSLVCFFLVAVVVPLFLPGDIEPGEPVSAPWMVDDSGQEAIHITIDEYGVIGYAIYPDMMINVFRLDTGEVIAKQKLFEDKIPTSYSFAHRGGFVVFGFEDGTLQYGKIEFETSFLNLRDVEEKYRNLEIGEVAQLGDGMIEVTPIGQYRKQKLAIEMIPEINLGANSPVRLVDITMLATGPIFASLTEDGVFRVNAIREFYNMMTDTTTYEPSGGQITLEMDIDKGMPDHLVLEGRADTALLIWNDGEVLRLDTRNRNMPVIAEKVELFDDPSVRLTALSTLVGKTTLVVGDSQGNVSTWFRVNPDTILKGSEYANYPTINYRANLHPPVAAAMRPATREDLPEGLLADIDDLLVCDTVDSTVFLRQYILPGSAGTSPVTAINASIRNRMVSAGYEDGRVDLLYVTSQRLLGTATGVQANQPVRHLAILPKNDGVFAATDNGFSAWRIDIPHPQTTVSAILGKVWYEGSPGPSYTWQSTAGDDAFESKFGLVPLIFGTLKATFYSMIFAVPLALLAAIYTSEFLHPKIKSKLKPTVEMMASLPSVVLGFLAALVFAPFVEQVVPFILMLFIMIPFTILLVSFIWQMLPASNSISLIRYRFIAIALVVPLGAFLAWQFSGVMEQLLFAGNVKQWLNWMPDPGTLNEISPYSSSIGAWTLLFLPVSTLIVTILITIMVNPMLANVTMGMDRRAVSILSLVKFAIGSICVFLLSLLVGTILNQIGLDPRFLGEFFGIFDISPTGVYAQRNALIVGFVMGFAVIPIIYTVAEDAISAVPEHLRAASLGAGATPWQTAIRIIVPTAMSGIFSACMIGLGRAVGETMIVLMATGNTPVLELSMFNGFRTLSANIAVELSEAVKDGTNYRMLFLAALTLFAMTFVVNTVAEIIRLRFRKKAFQL